PALAELGHHCRYELRPGRRLLPALGAVGPLDPAPYRVDLGRVGRRIEAFSPMQSTQGVEAAFQIGCGQLAGGVSEVRGHDRAGGWERFEAMLGTPGREVPQVGLVRTPSVRRSRGLGVSANPVQQIRLRKLSGSTLGEAVSALPWP